MLAAKTNTRLQPQNLCHGLDPSLAPFPSPNPSAPHRLTWFCSVTLPLFVNGDAPLVDAALHVPPLHANAVVSIASAPAPPTVPPVCRQPDDIFSVCAACTVTLAPVPIEHAALPDTTSVPVPVFTFTAPVHVTPPLAVVDAVVVSVPATLSAAESTTAEPTDSVAPDATVTVRATLDELGLSVNVPANTLSKPDPSNELPVKPHAFELWKTPPALTVTDPPVMLHVVVPLGMLSVLLADTDTLPAVIDRPPVVPLPSVVVAALPAVSASVPPLTVTSFVNVLDACTVT